MGSLIPCPSCRRHVESSAAACPFCAAAIVASSGASPCQGPCSGHRSPRLGRVAMMAVGATLLCASCFRSAVAAYGVAIFVDSGTDTADAGAQIDAASDADTDAEK